MGVLATLRANEDRMRSGAVDAAKVLAAQARKLQGTLAYGAIKAR